MLKTGSDRVPQQSLENIHIIKVLTEYRYADKDGKDQVQRVFFSHYMNAIYAQIWYWVCSLQGVNVREKAKIVLVLVEDEDKRKEEREFALKTKDKLAKAPNGNILVKL